MGSILFHWKLLPLVCIDVLAAWDCKLPLRRVGVELGWCKIAALDGERVNHFKLFVEIYSRATFLIEVVIFIFVNHCFLWVNAVQVLEVRAVIFDHFTKDLGLDLFNELIKGITIDEEPFPWWMGVEIKEEVYFVDGLKIFFDTPDR